MTGCLTPEAQRLENLLTVRPEEKKENETRTIDPHVMNRLQVSPHPTPLDSTGPPQARDSSQGACNSAPDCMLEIF